MAKPAPTAVPSSPAAPLPCGGERIIVADDEPFARSVMVRILERLGYQAVVARNGEEALARLSDESGAALLLIDATMPGLSGWKAAVQAQDRTPGLRVLVVSGAGVEPAHEAKLQRPHFQFLQKPFLPADLAHQVRRLLDAPAAEGRPS